MSITISATSLEYIAAKEPSHYFDSTQHQIVFQQKRDHKIVWNKVNRVGMPAWLEQDELNLVDSLWRDWFDEPYHSGGWNIDPLNLDALEAKPLRKAELRPFKIEYETYAEIKLRLLNSVISVKGHPFLVQRIQAGVNGFELAVTDRNKSYSVKYSDLTDLRSFPPMYVTVNQGPGWMCRIPGRVYQQGMNRSNTITKTVDSSGNIAALDVDQFIRNYNKRTTRKYDETLRSLLSSGELHSIRLSDDIAVRTDKGRLVSCFRGRRLGIIEDNDIRVDDEDDLLQGWIEQSAKDVGLGFRT